MHTHTYQYALATPVPESTPPEQRPNPQDAPLEPIGPPARTGATSLHADVECLDAELAELERKRDEQLTSLADAAGDPVAVAYRDSVARILAEIRVARHRLREGTHGVCVGCRGTVSRERVEALPWATQCADCARQRFS